MRTSSSCCRPYRSCGRPSASSARTSVISSSSRDGTSPSWESFILTKRHASDKLAARAGRAVLAGLDAAHVYAAVVGHHVAHLHLHLWPRYPQTPSEYSFDRVDEWPDAPLGDEQAIEATCARIRSAMDG